MRQVLLEYFGFEDFRDGQEAVIQSLLDGRPALAVFPTGGGKSLCYQVPALMMDGLTLVISPLIALMKDQVDRLVSRGIAAARLDSTLEPEALVALYERVENGSLRMLYIAPERLANEVFRNRIKRVNVAMVAVDEAHCISEWGHNFRPDYLKIARFCKSQKVKRILALTATATPKVAQDICKQFKIARKDHVQLSFHRPNLDLKVTPCQVVDRKALLLDRVQQIDGAVVVYVTRQETAEEVSTFLGKNGVSARAYHAGFPDELRSQTQAEFMASEVRVIVATIAFGMGIDKADIRGVIHYNMPKCLENYTQEIGRAGRDGQPAVCEMLICGDDLTVLENFIYSDTPSPQALRNLLDRILRLGDHFDLSLYDLSVSCDIRYSVISTVLAYLECDEVLEMTGTFYATYKVKLLRSRERILAGYAKGERDFLGKLLDRGKEARLWITFEPAVLALEMKVKTAKVVAALRDLEMSGDAALAVSGVRQAFRILKMPDDVKGLVARYADVFQRREQADLARLRQVLEIPAHAKCLTAYLLEYFGEAMKGKCGHCDRCRGVKGSAVGRSALRIPSDEDWRLLRKLAEERHPALSSPRQLARFLCGMSSPASTRARLSRHDAFGMFADLPFAEVLAMAEAV